LRSLSGVTGVIAGVGDNSIPCVAGEIRLFAIMRNESLRLAHFLHYYKSLGVDRFFLLDNDSSDDSASIGIDTPDVHVFKTLDDYRNHWIWMEYMLEKFGNGHWCLVVDIDELFYYPAAESLSIKDLCKYMEGINETSIKALLLDMYSTEAIPDIKYENGGNPLDIVSCFDKDYQNLKFPFYNRKKLEYYYFDTFTGGMRDRVFGKSTPPTILSKVPLFKNVKGTYLSQGMHAISGSRLSSLQAVVFHTKFLSDFISEVKEECIREQHYGGAFYYKIFKKKIDENPELNFHFEGSVKFKDSQQLIDLGMMKTTDAFEKYIEKIQEDATQLDPS
jgi:hypothetical protein